MINIWNPFFSPSHYLPLIQNALRLTLYFWGKLHNDGHKPLNKSNDHLSVLTRIGVLPFYFTIKIQEHYVIVRHCQNDIVQNDCLDPTRLRVGALFRSLTMGDLRYQDKHVCDAKLATIWWRLSCFCENIFQFLQRHLRIQASICTNTYHLENNLCVIS